MKTRLILAALAAFLWIALNAVLAEPGHHGYPNHGITAPGQPNHYASPRGPKHP